MVTTIKVTPVQALSHAGYRLLVFVLTPAMLMRLWLKGGAYRLHWAERLWGQVPQALRTHSNEVRTRPLLWLHAVSVGETQAAYPLLKAWLTNTPDGQILLTHTTPTGRQTGARLFSEELHKSVFQSYLPYDLPWAVSRFLKQTRPSLGLLMETELWPELLLQAERLGVPVALINGRLSERSARQMRRFAWLAQPALKRLRLILVQAEEHRQRFAALTQSTVSLHRTGSLKFDLTPSETLIQQGQSWRRALEGPPDDQAHPLSVVLLASSRDDEEIGFLASWKRHAPSQVRLVLVPRHPERFDRVVQLARDAGFSVGRRSQGAPDTGAEVWVGDSLGEMQAYIAMSDLVVMGGSLLPLGGQNPIEACAQGRPVMFGPHMFNFPEVSRQLVESGAGAEVADADAAVRLALEWASQPSERARRGDAARRYADQHRGATDRSLAALREAGLL